ncbi:MAG: hypothetical protein IMW89_13535 [Ktedonobacteraceae bacterium]|nr:hypothetical protein [Ktedonobacteraceae bacterium]
MQPFVPGPPGSEKAVGPADVTRTQKVVIIAIALFALAGLISGFTIGTVVRPAKTPVQPPARQNQITVIAGKTPTATATPTPSTVPLGCPAISLGNTAVQQADGATTYTISAQARDKSAPCPKGKPVQAAGITCKLWLVQRIPDGKILQFKDAEADKLKHIEQLNGPLTGSVQDNDYPEIQGLQFDQTTPQTQQCNNQGQANWKYVITPTVPAGDYCLLVLTDWNGKYYNWSWINIVIQKKN